jgi:hypothetical protein
LRLKQYNLKLTEEQIAFLKGLPNASEWIRNAINEKMLKEQKSIFSILNRIEQISDKIEALWNNPLRNNARLNIEIIEENENRYPYYVYALDMSKRKFTIRNDKEMKECYERSKKVIEAFNRNIKKLWNEKNELLKLLEKT